MSAPRQYTLTFGGAGSQEIKAQGLSCVILSVSSADVYLTIDSGSELKKGAGQGVNLGAGATPFNRFTVRSTVAQTVLVEVADVPQPDNQEAVAVSVTANVAAGNDLDNGGDVSVPATSSAVLLAADAGYRLAALIRNPSSNTETIRIGKTGVGAASGYPLEPGDAVAIAYDGAIYAYNPGATAQSVSALGIRSI